MCHSTVFWYSCDHLILSDTICPFRGTLVGHGNSETNTAYTEDACCLCKQPWSPAVESLKTNQFSCHKLATFFQLESRDARFPELVTRFFAGGEHLQWNRPGSAAVPATPAPAPATVQAITPSPTVVDGSPAASRRSPMDHGKRSPSAQNKQPPPTHQMNSSPASQSKQDKQPRSPPQPTPQRQPTPANSLSSDDLLVAEALHQWEREVSVPGNDFTTVDFDAIKSMCELEDQFSIGFLSQGSQIDGSVSFEIQHQQNTPVQHEAPLHQPMQHGLPLHHQGTPYDGTNWGQEGVYLPTENYYFAGDKARSPVVKAQVSSSPLPAMDPALNEERSLLAYTNFGDGNNNNNNNPQSITNHAPAAHTSYEQPQSSPITHLSPKEIHQLTTTPTRSKTKAKTKAKSTASASVSVIDEYSTEHNTGEGRSTSKRTAKATSNAAKDPTRGIKDSASRVTKPSPSSSSGSKKPSKAKATTATPEQQQPSSRKQWVSIPRPPPEAIIVPQNTQQQLQYTMSVMMLPCF